jgi:K+-transporting ATPase A subunit
MPPSGNSGYCFMSHSYTYALESKFSVYLSNLITIQNIQAKSKQVGFVVLIALMMEVARTSETLVNFYQTTWRYNPEDSHLRNRNNFLSYY